MAEGLLSGIMGDEEEKPEVEAPNTLAGAEAFASAVAAKLAGSDPEVARDTSAFLKKQAHLLEIQAKHLEGEYAARLHMLLSQSHEVDIRRLGLRLRVSFQIFGVLAATVIGLGFAMMIRDALTSRRVVVDPFHAPPSLAARGIDGTVVGSALLDELSRLQNATRSNVQKLDQSNGWSSQVKLEVPEAGISLGELSRLLKERYGHDVHIDGDLVETPTGGLALTVRGNGVPASTFEGAATELGKVTTQAAEYVYARSQPARWAITCRTRAGARKRSRFAAPRSEAPASRIAPTCSTSGRTPLTTPADRLRRRSDCTGRRSNSSRIIGWPKTTS